MLPRVILETPRLMLRELSREDLDFVAAMRGDPEVMRFFPACLTREESAAWIEGVLDRYQRDGVGQWLAVDRQRDTPVGTCGLLAVEIRGAAELEVGYMIHRPFWRQGFATEAAAACRDLAFEALGRDRVVARIRPENTPSEGVARKIGMTPEPGEILHAGLVHRVFSVEPKERGRSE
jgi:RimJ/RimL family protein N-acetyltransferase